MAGLFEKGDLVNGKQASLSSRFILEIDGIDVALIDGVTRPGYKIETEQFQLLEYQINFPKTIKFDNTITFNIIEMLDPDVTLTQMENIMSRIINDNFYTTPSALNPAVLLLGAKAGYKDAKFNLSKGSLTGNYISIHTLDSEGRRYDSIRLINPMITTVKPSDLKYSSDEINKIAVTVTFDYTDYGRNDIYNYGNTIDKAKSLFPESFYSIKNK
jgi:hypothetical protein